VIALAAVFAAACLPPAPGPGPGLADPFRPPAAEATQLNADAKVLYRQGKWDDARAKYRAAEEADPDFLAPRLNIACSFVRQERFDEAVAEVRGLLDRAYMPWSHEVLEAADLGALKVQPQMAQVRQSLGTAAAAWGAGLEDAVVFVGRERAPLRIPPAGAGEFILNAHQEVFAYLPQTGRFRQLTAEDGHVLAMVRSADRRRITYVKALKLIRGEKADEVTLDGVVIVELTPATMTDGPHVEVRGPVARIEARSTAHGLVFHVTGLRTNGWFLLGSAGTLVPAAPAPTAPVAMALTAAGAQPVPIASVGGPCGVVARDRPGSGGATRVIHVTAHGRTRTIGERFGAGLAGLPLPR
jgi:hypothetical protein